MTIVVGYTYRVTFFYFLFFYYNKGLQNCGFKQQLCLRVCQKKDEKNKSNKSTNTHTDANVYIYIHVYMKIRLYNKNNI